MNIYVSLLQEIMKMLVSLCITSKLFHLKIKTICLEQQISVSINIIFFYIPEMITRVMLFDLLIILSCKMFLTI